MLLVAGVPVRQLAHGRRGRRGVRARLRADRALPARAADRVPEPVGRRRRTPASSRCRARSRSARAACFGLGPGESVQKIFFLPEAHTDFILAVIGEELGRGGNHAACSFLYGMIAYAGLRTAKAAKGVYAKLLAAGLTSLILCQALLNVYAVLGLAPLTGVPLPFISSGSTSLIVLLCSMGLLLNIAGGGSAHLAGRRRTEQVAMTRIVIAAGGTAGHVVPAIAVADALRAEGAEVVFVGGERAEAELVPGRRLPLRAHRRRGHLALEPARRPPARSARPAARSAPRADPARATARTPCSAAAATSPARSAWPRSLRGIPLVLTEADSHLGLTNRAAGALAPAASAWPSRSTGRDGRALRRHRPAGAAARRRPRRRPRARFGIGAGRDLRARVRRLARRPLDQPRGGRGVRGRPVPRPARRGPRDFAEPRRRPGRTTTCATTSRPFGQALAAADLVGRARRRLDLRGRPVRAAGGPRPVSARERRPPDHQRPLDGRARAPRS